VTFIPPSSLELCDLCHDLHAPGNVEFNGRQFLCAKCREEKCSAESRRVPSDKNVLNQPISTP
jgi:hypothetical protein